MQYHRLPILLGALACACACADAPEPVSQTHAPAPGGPAQSESEPPAEPQAPRELMFTAQEGWIEETPASSARKAQYRLPRVEGDPEDAELVVYFFPGGGGSIEDNIDRWASQFEQPDGRDSKQLMQRRTYHVNNMGVEEISLSGTYVAETTPGSGQRVNKPDFAVRAAILSSDHGPYYAKVTGPARTIEHWESSFRSFVASVQP